jgi:hypothetical protein
VGEALEGEGKGVSFLVLSFGMCGREGREGDSLTLSLSSLVALVLVLSVVA